MEQLEKQDKTVRKLKKQLKVFAKKIGELEGIFIFWEKVKNIYFFLWSSHHYIHLSYWAERYELFSSISLY